MDTINISIAIVGIINFFIGFFIYLKGKKREINLSFSFLTISVILWVISMIFYRMTGPDGEIFWAKFLYFSASTIPLSFFYFVYLFSEEKKSFNKKKWLFILSIFLLLNILVFTKDLIIKNVVDHFPLEKEIVWGPFYPLYVVYIILFFNWSLAILYKKYKKTENKITKIQIEHILIGSIISIAFAFMSNLILPSFKEFGLNWFGQLVTIIWIGFIAYSIVRHRLMDIRIVVRQITVYGVSFILSIGFSLLLMVLALNYLSFYISSPLIGSAILVFGIIVFQLVKDRFSKFANKHLFFTLYSYEKTLADLTEKLSRTIDLNRLVNLTTESIKDVMKLDKISLVLHKIKTLRSELKLIENHQPKNGTDISKEKRSKTNFYLVQNISFGKKGLDSLIQNDIIIQYLEQTKKPLVKDEITHLIEEFDNESDREILRKLNESMKELGASLYLPLIIENKLIGLFILGKKVSGDAYTIQDLNLLETVANQIAIAINNAQLYEQSQYFNQILKVRVAEATQELAEAYRELKRLDDSKTEFLSLASHQLRTPLSAIKGYLSMVLEGNYGKLLPSTEKALQDVYQSNERLISLVNDLLNITRIEAGQLEYHPHKTDFSELIEGVIKELDVTLKNKNIVLKSAIAKIPMVNIDLEKIRQVLINLVDNAVKYTEKGSITIQVKRVKDQILVEIKDTGIGITPEKMETLFKWFSRGKGALRLDVGGFGLGLYIAKKIVEKAGGKIWAKSKGEGKGSTFAFSLPIE